MANYPDLARYDDERLDLMLKSYRKIAKDHADHGHYGLARWALGMCTEITCELTYRWSRAAATDQLSLDFDDAA